MAKKSVILTQKGPVALIQLNQPERGNRVTLDMAWELRQICQRLNVEGKAQVVILTGAGESFCCGGEQLLDDGDSSSPPLDQRLESYRAASSIGGLKIASIAAINGNALDQGLELALACDLRIAAEGASLGFSNLSKGIIPWDGGTQRLPRTVGRSRALELFLTGRLVQAEEACRIGLVNKVVPLEELQDAAQEMASAISSGAPIAVQYIKEAVHKGADMALEQGLNLEADLSFILQSTNDRHEGVQAFLNKRKPKFSGE